MLGLARFKNFLEDRVPKQVLDQSTHFLWAFIALAPICFFPHAITGALSGALFALPREWEQHDYKFKLGRGSLLDLLFFSIGGVVIGWIAI